MDEKEFDSLNVIPLVDIMLVLLTIVLTTSTFIATGVISVNLPQASESSTDMLETHVIAIDQQEQIYLSSRPISLRDLRMELNRIDRSAPILIRADKAVVLQAFVNVLNMLKEKGFMHISLQTEARS